MRLDQFYSQIPRAMKQLVKELNLQPIQGLLNWLIYREERIKEIVAENRRDYEQSEKR